MRRRCRDAGECKVLTNSILMSGNYAGPPGRNHHPMLCRGINSYTSPLIRADKMYEARKICNLIIARYGERSFDLTNLRLNKLLYFIQGWSLTSRPEGLIRNHFLAWQHGPVIRPVYDAFKSYGDSPISGLAEYLDYSSGITKPIYHNDISPADADTIMRVFESYAPHTTSELRNLSHEPGGPWDIVYRACLADKRMSPRIPNDLIRAHFLEKAGGKSRH